MGGVHEPAAVWQRRADDSLDTELLDEDERAAHVDERVERAELVEVDVLGLTPWMPPSTSASRLNASSERARARSGRSASATSSRISR